MSKVQALEEDQVQMRFLETGIVDQRYQVRKCKEISSENYRVFRLIQNIVVRSESRQDQIVNGHNNGSMICLAKSWGNLFTQKICRLNNFPQLFKLIALTLIFQNVLPDGLS